MAKRKANRMRKQNKKSVNLLGVAESAMILNAVTTNLFNANLPDFIMGTRDGSYKAGVDGSYRLTIPEILGVGALPFGGVYGASANAQNIPEVMWLNAKKNFLPLVANMVLIPVGFRLGAKITRKPRALVNKSLKMSGLGVKV